MDRNSIISALIERETGMIWDGEWVWNEVEDAVRNQFEDEGEKVWVTGEDTIFRTTEFLVTYKMTHDEECDCWDIEIHLHKIRINDKRKNKTWDIQVEGATL